MAEATLRDLYNAELDDLYAAEHKIVDTLPTMVGAAHSRDLREALETHLERTRIHIERLDLLFLQTGVGQHERSTTAIDGIIRTAERHIRDTAVPQVRDAALIAAAQHVEHYEMAGYGCARTYARQLGDDNAAELLQHTLDEEGEADKELTRIAEASIVQQAAEIAGAEERRRPRLSYVSIDDLPREFEYRDFKVRNTAGDNLGQIDGLIVDRTGRPYYFVVKSGAVFGRRFMVPDGKLELRRGERALLLDVDEDTFKRYPEFHADAFEKMSDEEARRFEWRALEGADPEAARRTPIDWKYGEFACYVTPEWLGTFFVVVPEDEEPVAARERSSRRYVPIERETAARDRTVAREDSEHRSDMPREEIRGKGPDEKAR